ncbi:MAG: hypothetical protein M2R46_05160 [Verrucomicrobia subdivision 3 bacterium]|nr:hypothetical protein [Limisphaerales bacterium]
MINEVRKQARELKISRRLGESHCRGTVETGVPVVRWNCGCLAHLHRLGLPVGQDPAQMVLAARSNVSRIRIEVLTQDHKPSPATNL